MRQQATNHMQRIHPGVAGLEAQFRDGRLDRREFLRTVTLLGLSVTAAYALAGGIVGERLVDPAAAGMGTGTGTPGRGGGILRVSMPIPEIADPATYDWVAKSNVSRHVVEYLTITGADNVTRPYLAERWEPSDDLRTWTFHLRRDVKWHNGDEFTAEDVEFNFRRWLDPRTGSSNQALFRGMLEEVQAGEAKADGSPKVTKRMRQGAFERVDNYTFRLHLSRPALAIPENLYNYPAAILHRSFDDAGSDLSKRPVGTGPYTLTEFEVGKMAVLRRTGHPYWGGEVLLDEIRYVDYGPASATQLAAFASGQVDMVHEFDVASLNMAASIPHGVVHEAQTAATSCVRMRLTEPPFDNRKLRQAILACVDAGQYPKLVFQGRGQPGEHHHVAPIHPEYFALPKLEQDFGKARRLLAEAGYPDGLALAVDCGNTDGPWQQQLLELLRSQLEPAGIDLNIQLMPAAQYWEVWDKTPFGITSWLHRPLGTMTLSLAYRADVPWNETNYSNPEFDAALSAAEAEIDPSERKLLMERVEAILQGDAVMVQPAWVPRFSIASRQVQDLEAHPSGYHDFRKVWLAHA